MQDPLLNRRFFVKGSAAVGLGLMAGTTPLSAEDSPDWESIFDGQTTDGWHKTPSKGLHGTGGRWTVKNGVLVGEQDPPGSGNGGVLLSDRKLADFELSLDMNPDWGPCSGIFFRANEKGYGYQMYVDYHDRGNVGHLRGEMKPKSFAMMPFKIFGELDESKNLKSLRSEPDPRKAKWPAGVYKSICTAEDWLEAWKVNDWNHCVVRCVGKYPRINVWINELHVCDWDGATSTLPEYDKELTFNTLGRSGSIGLQVHGGNGWPKGAQVNWRNIKVREI